MIADYAHQFADGETEIGEGFDVAGTAVAVAAAKFAALRIKKSFLAQTADNNCASQRACLDIDGRIMTPQGP